jgi:hypothetical protein
MLKAERGREEMKKEECRMQKAVGEKQKTEMGR